MNLPNGILTQHVAVLGKTRSGKSSVMRGLVEGLLEQHKPVCIIDPKGDWWGIKLAADGKGPGYPVVIFGGEHADVPINEHAGASVAELFATGNRPCLIDLGGWMVRERTRFWVEFASTLFKHTKGERWLVVDEVHNFAPKGKVMDPEAGKALHWANRLASEGLGKGLAMVFASQRPQKVHNDTLTSAETLIAMRVLHPSDRGAVSDWIKGCGDSSGDEVLASLAQMERGEGWVWSPEIGFGPKRVKFPMFTTYDSFRPQTVADTKRLTGWAEVDLDEVRTKFAATIEKAKADDPKELRKTIADLQRQLQSTKIALPAERLATRTLPNVVEKPVITDAQLERIDKQLQAFESAVERAAALVSKPAALVREGVAQLAAAVKSVRQPALPLGTAKTGRSYSETIPSAQKRPDSFHPSSGDLPVGEKATLICAAQYPDGVTREQCSILTGYKRSTRDAYIQRLVGRGFVDVRGALVIATPEGIAALGTDYDPLPVGEELQRYWLDRLPSGETSVLTAAIAAYPHHVARERIDERTGFKRSTRDAYIQRLVARKLVVAERGAIRASDVLFQED